MPVSNKLISKIVGQVALGRKVTLVASVPETASGIVKCEWIAPNDDLIIVPEFFYNYTKEDYIEGYRKDNVFHFCQWTFAGSKP